VSASRVYTVVRHGREIEVEEVTGDDTAPAPAARCRKPKDKPFAFLYLSPAAKAFAAMNCPKAMVWAWLVHKARTTGSNAITIPNGALAKYGVSRRVKHLALRQLEQAGLITVERKPRKTLVVTLV
jgi:hypothetical protein